MGQAAGIQPGRSPQAHARGQDGGASDRPAGLIADADGHICLGCGCQIAEGLREIRVPQRGRKKGTARYRHANSADCAGALRAPQPNTALIGRYKALPTFSWPPGHASEADGQDSAP